MNKKGLDEMQLHRKNEIGNQTFLLLLYLLLLDAGLYGFGFKWVSYPANIMIILTICSGIYVVRLIRGNAVAGPSAEKEKPALKITLSAIIAVSAAAAIIVLLKNAGISNSKIDDMGAPILFITAAIAISIAVTTSIIKKIQNNKDLE